MHLISIEHLAFQSFGPFSFYVDANETVSIMGPSGAGKTLLLRSLADLDEHSGNIMLQGIESSSIKPNEWRRQVAMLPAEVQWWRDQVADHFQDKDMSAWQALGFGEEVLRWQVSRLSQGEKQRLGLLRLLSLQPRVLLLDEPTANLDQKNTQRVERFVMDYRAQHQAAVIWVTHSQEQAMRVASRHLVIDNNVLCEAHA